MKKALPILIVALMILITSTSADARKRTTRYHAPRYYQQYNYNCYDPVYGYYDCGNSCPNCTSRGSIVPVGIIINGFRFDVNGYLINNRTYVPVRAVFQRLGATVDFVKSTGEIIVRYGSRTMVMRIGDNAARTFQAVYYMDGSPMIIRDTTYVPLRFVTDFLGVHVDWNYYDNSVRITTGQYYREPYYFVW